MKRYLIAFGVVASLAVLAVAARTSQAFLNPQEAVDTQGRMLTDGALISASDFGDPDIFIIKYAPVPGVVGFGTLPDEGSLGYKRLFLNPAIFSMYGHLGGFANVRRVTPRVRDAFATSGLFRNCETTDQRVWATEVTGEDDGILHHVELTGDQARAEDPFFFHKVFCINSREDNFYAKSVQPYRRLADIPVYFRRTCMVRPACLDSEPRCLPPEPAEGWCPRGCYYSEVQCVRAPCDPVLVCPSPTPTPTCEPLPPCAQSGANPQCALAPTGPNGRPWCQPSPTPGPCYVSGCSNQLCADQPGMVSTCEWRNEYYCYQRYGRCERQSSGHCGWTSTNAFNSCVANPPAQ